MKKIFALSLAVLMLISILCSCKAGINPASDFKYTINKDDTISITKYIGNDDTVIIPSEIDGRSVCYISDNAFENSDIKSITFSASITEIGVSAFANCQNLVEISGWEGVTKISDNAFRKCSKLEKVIIPSNVESTGSGAFAECDSLKEVYIPKSVTYMYASFAYNSSLEKVTFEEGMQELSAYALFAKCPKLKTLTIPESVNEFSDAVFWDTGSLESVKFLGNVPEFHGDTLFPYREKDLTIYYSKNASGWDNTTLSAHTLIPY